MPDTDSITQCQILTPTNALWTVENGVVLDDQSNEVDGYTGNDQGDATKTCGIDIQAVDNETDVGKEKYIKL